MIDQITDCHIHILPGVDDGAKNWEMAKEMLSVSFDQGVREMIVTPHWYERFPNAFVSDLDQLTQELQDYADRITAGAIKLHLGTELYFCDKAVEYLESSKARTLAGSDYVLVEFAPSVEFSYLKRSLQELQFAGYSPVLAHVERYLCLYGNYCRIEELVEMGLVIQMNASTVTGEHHSRDKRFARKLIRFNLLHLIGTDAHSNGKRSPKIRKCAEYLSKKFGEEIARQLLWVNPQRIIYNQKV